MIGADLIISERNGGLCPAKVVVWLHSIEPPFYREEFEGDDGSAWVYVDPSESPATADLRFLRGLRVDVIGSQHYGATAFQDWLDVIDSAGARLHRVLCPDGTLLNFETLRAAA